MTFLDLWNRGKPTLSFEFYPGQSEKSTLKLQKTISELLSLEPDFLSVTFGAGGSSRSGSLELLRYIRQQSSRPLVGYLAAYGLDRSELAAIASRYETEGVDALLAIRGDIPADHSILPHANGCPRASDLLLTLKKSCRLPIGVAAYPEGHVDAPDVQTDWNHLLEKIGCGADFIITQYFYDNDDFYRLQDFLHNNQVTIPLLAGIMPIYNIKLSYSLAEKCGAKIPMNIRKKLDSLATEDKESIQALGLEIALMQCRDLLDHGVDGLHFYTMDRSSSVQAILQTLRKESSL